MDLEKLRSLFDLLAEKDIAEFEHEEEGVRVRVSRGARVVVGPALPAASPAAHSVAPPVVLSAGSMRKFPMTVQFWLCAIPGRQNFSKCLAARQTARRMTS